MKKLLIIGLMFSSPAFAYDWHDGQGSSYGNDFERGVAADRKRAAERDVKESWDRAINHGQPHHGGYDD